MKNQTGARFLARKNRKVTPKDQVMLHSIKRESELIRLESGAVKRVK